MNNAKNVQKVIQLVPALYMNDAVGNEVRAISKMLDEQGIDNFILAETVDERIMKEKTDSPGQNNSKIYTINTGNKLYEILKKIKNIKNKKNCKKFKPFLNLFRISKQSSVLKSLGKEDVVIYHMASGSRLAKVFSRVNGKKLMRYHNVTPPEMLEPYNKSAARNCKRGLAEMKRLIKLVDKCVAVSTFNRQCLIDAGCTCPVDVVPIILDMEKYRIPQATESLSTPADLQISSAVQPSSSRNRTVISFIGRIAPNKKHEDIIKTFSVYSHNYNPDSTLVLVGGDGGYEKYTRELKELSEELGISDKVIFKGQADNTKVLACYKSSDVFLCMSEHEGFCVPIIEAFLMDIPVVAYASCAIPETMGGAGILVEKKDYDEIARIINKIVTDAAFCKEIIEGQRKRLEELDSELIKKRMLLSIFE
ncbi:MAG: glycosyltransferase family 4 protein [Lachnospira sp.]